MFAATTLPALAAVQDGSDSALVGWGLTVGALGFLPVAVQGIVYVRFPTGQPGSWRGRVLEVVIIADAITVAFDQRDRRLLEDVARHAGVAVHAEALTADLTESRQHLVTAREEERRRIRRDLHDGLGPILTAVGLNIDAARSRLATNASAADQHLSDAREATRQALDDIRRLVHGLRPPALDNLGLVGALELHMGRLTTAHCCIVVDAENLPGLPAAIEVAAYRITVEAVTNTIRHTTSSTCSVRLEAERETLLINVRDNGGPNAPWTPSVGILSMREQAWDLGGDLTCGSDEVGGIVTARLPLPAGPPATGPA